MLDAASRYLEDSKYYLGKGDLFTALATVSYAEGLIDSLRYLGLRDVSWPYGSEKRAVVIVGGTFDLIHPGHLALLEYAASKGDLYVIVARDKNVKAMKGREPILPEEARLKIVKSIRYVKDAVLGDLSDFIKPLEALKPDVIVLGPDQPFDETELKRQAEGRIGRRVTIERFPERVAGPGLTSTSAIINEIIKRFCRP